MRKGHFRTKLLLGCKRDGRDKITEVPETKVVRGDLTEENLEWILVKGSLGVADKVRNMRDNRLR